MDEEVQPRERRRRATTRLSSFVNFSGRHRLATRFKSSKTKRPVSAGSSKSLAAVTDGQGASASVKARQPGNVGSTEVVPAVKDGGGPSGTNAAPSREDGEGSAPSNAALSRHGQPEACQDPLPDDDFVPHPSKEAEEDDDMDISLIGLTTGKYQRAERTAPKTSPEPVPELNDEETLGRGPQMLDPSRFALPKEVDGEDEGLTDQCNDLDESEPDDTVHAHDGDENEPHHVDAQGVEGNGNDHVDASRPTESSGPAEHGHGIVEMEGCVGIVIEDDLDAMEAELLTDVDVVDGSPLKTGVTSMTVLRKRLSKIVSWSALLSLMCVDGSVSFTEKQYEILDKAIRSCGGRTNLMSSTTLRTTFRSTLLRHCYPRSSIVRVCDGEDNANAPQLGLHQVAMDDGALVPTRDAIRLVLPSEWAALDVATASFYNSVFDGGADTSSSAVDVEYSPLVTDREDVLMRRPCLHVRLREKFCTLPAKIGDRVSFPCVRDPKLSDHGIRGWTTTTMETLNATKDGVAVVGVLGPTFGVGFNDQWRMSDCYVVDERLPKVYNDAEMIALKAFANPTTTFGSRRDAFKNMDKRYRDKFEAEITDSTSTLRSRTKTSRRTLTDVQLFAGDTVTVVRMGEEEWSEGYICVLVASPVSGTLRRPTERLLWVKVTRSTAHTHHVRARVDAVVHRVPFFSESERKMASLEKTNRNKSNMGVLRNGERYVVYRVSMYADGFQEKKSTRQSKSVGGCYILPLGLPEAERCTSQAVRVVTLTAPGQSITKVVQLIMADLKKGATEGVVGTDPFGRHVRIFIDTVALLGDLPQAAAYTDVLGHTATALCTLCTMRKRKKSKHPETNYSSHVHSARMGLRRFDARRQAIRLKDGNPDLLRMLGMMDEEYMDRCHLPAVWYSKELRDCPVRVENTEGVHPVPLCFDHALSIPALPDHLLSTLIKYVLHAAFNALSDDGCRYDLEARIVSGALSNGLQVKRHFLSWAMSRGERSYAGMASNSMSNWFSLLLIAAVLFKDIHAASQAPAHLLPELLQNVCAAMYTWPKVEVSGRGTPNWAFSSKRDQLEYHHCIAQLAVKFSDAARTVHFENPELGCLMDKPVLHRLAELAFHTVPTNGHALLCSELVLEHTHTVFKQWLQNNTHADVHLTAVEKAVGRDWLWRLSVLYGMWLKEGPEEASKAEIVLRRILLGEEGVQIDTVSPSGQQLVSDLRESLKVAMNPPVEDMLTECVPSNFAFKSTAKYGWCVHARKDASNEPREVKSTVQDLVSSGATGFSTIRDMVYYRRVRFMALNTYGRSRGYRHNAVECGEAMSVVVGDDGPSTDERAGRVQPVVPREDGNGRCVFFIVASIVTSVTGGKVWAVVRQLNKKDDAYSCDGSPLRCVELNDGVRRVALVHQCTDACVADVRAGTMTHAQSTLDGGVYHVIGRDGGYPPFLG